MELSGVFWGTFIQTSVDEEYLGRVSSLDYAASFGLVPVGYAIYGVLGNSGGNNGLILVLSAGILVGFSLLMLIIVGIVSSEDKRNRHVSWTSGHTAAENAISGYRVWELNEHAVGRELDLQPPGPLTFLTVQAP